MPLAVLPVKSLHCSQLYLLAFHKISFIADMASLKPPALQPAVYATPEPIQSFRTLHRYFTPSPPYLSPPLLHAKTKFSALKFPHKTKNHPAGTVATTPDPTPRVDGVLRPELAYWGTTSMIDNSKVDVNGKERRVIGEKCDGCRGETCRYLLNE
ncbi:hypothetical protein M7I_4242 [Glarea lozoyensis 74030]|uniref:Uncharacterized protein n=1 Tax=Glarea lozoyensis (strain ATCC 74030 / MF5533) TaxID=1104152 RepID=H0ENN3_GLAL7|nr:hypothetical protein M7I_4242 [Glarea lozoyensis 74030]